MELFYLSCNNEITIRSLKNKAFILLISIYKKNYTNESKVSKPAQRHLYTVPSYLKSTDAVILLKHFNF